MADDSKFRVDLIARDQAGPEVAKVSQHFAKLSKTMQTIGAHMRGVGLVTRAALGSVATDGAEAAHGIGKVAEAAGHLGKSMHSARTEAHGADKAMEALGEHARGYETLAAHMTLLHMRFGNVRAGFGEFGHGLGEILPVLGGLAVGGGLGEIAEQVNQTAEKFSDLSRAASVAGATMQQMQQINFAASMHDIDAAVPERAMFRLGVTMAQAHAHQNKLAQSLFAHLHIDPSKYTPATLLPKLADAFKATHSVAMQKLMAQTLFGRGGGELLPVLTLGGAELQKLFAQSDNFQFTPSKEQLESLEKLHATMTTLKASVQGFRDAVGTSLAPVLTPVVDTMARWVRANRDWLASDITDLVKHFSDAMQHVDWKSVGAALKTLGEDAQAVADRIGGFQHVVEALIALKVTSWAAGFAGKVAGLSRDILELTAAVKAFDAAINGSLLGRVFAKIPVLGSAAAAGVGAGLYTLFNPTQTDKGERAKLDAWLRAHHIQPPPHPDTRALSNAVAAANAARPAEPSAHGARPGFPAPLHYGETPPTFPRLFDRAGVRGAAPADGSVNVNIQVKGLPARSAIRTDSSGAARLGSLTVTPDEEGIGRASADLGMAW